MGLLNGQPMAKGNLRSVEGHSIDKHGQYPNLKKKNLYIKIKDGNPSIKCTRQMRSPKSKLKCVYLCLNVNLNVST